MTDWWIDLLTDFIGTNVVSLDVEVVERDCNAVLRWRHYQPDAVLVGRVDTRVERTRNRSVRSVDVAATRVCTAKHFSYAQTPLTSICCRFVVQHALQQAVRQIHNKLKAKPQHVVQDYKKTRSLRLQQIHTTWTMGHVKILYSLLYDLLSNKSTANLTSPVNIRDMMLQKPDITSESGNVQQAGEYNLILEQV